MGSLGFIPRGVVGKGKGAAGHWPVSALTACGVTRSHIHFPGTIFLSIPVLMAPGPAASVLPENLPEMQILTLLQTAESESPEVRPKDLF